VVGTVIRARERLTAREYLGCRRLLLSRLGKFAGESDADCGDNCEDPPRIFCPGQADQGDLP
jgi:hypothetical protein